MVEEVPQQPNQASEFNTYLRDIEERQRIIKDRVILLGKSLIEERDKTFTEIQEIKKSLIKIEEDTKTIKNFMQKVTGKLENTVRKEEMIMLQRQFDLFRK